MAQHSISAFHKLTQRGEGNDSWELDDDKNIIRKCRSVPHCSDIHRERGVHVCGCEMCVCLPEQLCVAQSLFESNYIN